MIPQRQRPLAPWLIAIFGTILLSHFLIFTNPPLARTEVHRALVAIDALDHGNWIVTRILDEVYLRKPPFHPWTLAASAAIFDTREPWVFRFPSILAAATSATWLAWLGSRWFGRRAGIITGFAFLWLIPLWAQSRSAEIDALNTTLALITWGCLLELTIGRPRHAWRWTLLATLSLAAALLSKGPAALTLVLPALFAPLLTGIPIRSLLRPAILPILPIAAAIAAAWPFTVELYAAQTSTEVDQAAIAEVIDRFAAVLDPAHMLNVLAMPFELLVFALPVSLVAGLALLPSIRQRFTTNRRHRLATLLIAIGLSGVTSVLFLLENPRYGYILLPPLCLPAAAILSHWLSGRLPAWVHLHASRTAVILALLAFAGAAAVIWQLDAIARSAAIFVLALTLPILLFALVRARQIQPAGWLIVATATLAASSTGYTLIRADNRVTLSSVAYAQTLKQNDNLSPGTTVITGRLWNDKPGLFYYADLQPRQRLDLALNQTPSDLSDLYLLYTRERTALEATYPGQVEPILTIDQPRLTAHLVRLHASPADTP
ncbi:ArnT family glycosyltransferase [Mucisphaera sp.]|uniref:ArnT family glycosyltransferase n=1 Tax=Mucisphaera sp. TaxID=2913024 RepID=UPI003D146BC4